MTLEFSRQIFVKSSNIKFHENPSNGSRAVPCGWRTDIYEANSRFLAILRTRLKKHKFKRKRTPVTKNCILWIYRKYNRHYAVLFWQLSAHPLLTVTCTLNLNLETSVLTDWLKCLISPCTIASSCYTRINTHPFSLQNATPCNLHT